MLLSHSCHSQMLRGLQECGVCVRSLRWMLHSFFWYRPVHLAHSFFSFLASILLHFNLNCLAITLFACAFIPVSADYWIFFIYSIAMNLADLFPLFLCRPSRTISVNHFSSFLWWNFLDSVFVLVGKKSFDFVFHFCFDGFHCSQSFLCDDFANLTLRRRCCRYQSTHIHYYLIKDVVQKEFVDKGSFAGILRAFTISRL